MGTVALLGTGTALLLAGSLCSLLVASDRRSSGWVSTGFVTVASVVLWAAVVRVFRWGPDPEVALLALPSIGASLVVAVDRLAALFLAIVATLAFLTTLFSVEYMAAYRNDSVARYYPVLLIFFAGMVGVVATADLLFFIVFWELMTLTSFFLVIFESESDAAQRAGLKYFVVTHLVTLGMAAGAIILWRHSGSFHFSAARAALADLLADRPAVAHLVIFLFSLCFATKSGVLPMGSWLPDAYPAAPTAATAAFGGTMSKLGIYGLLRLFLCLVPFSRATAAWGMVLALAGASSIFVATLTALRQDDFKRLMSFHAIGQVGYMLVGIGAGLYLLDTQPALGLLALLGGVLHLINNSLYKPCLFLGAGAVLYRTGKRTLDQAVGLGSVMPVTAACAALAALAISGIPPLNGFTSKWLIYAGAILGGRESALLIVLGLLAMFVSLVTLASFLKYLGAVFLGPPTARRDLREVPAGMVIPQAVLALVCVVFGLVPLLPLGFVHQAITVLVPGRGLPSLSDLLGSGTGLEASAGAVGVAFWAPPVAAVALAASSLVAYLVQRSARAPVRQVEVWYCGEQHGQEEARYRAAGFYLPFKHAFDGIYPSFRLRPPKFPAALRRALDFDNWLYRPLVRLLGYLTAGAGRSHVGVPQVYLLWMVAGALAVVGIMLSLGG